MNYVGKHRCLLLFLLGLLCIAGSCHRGPEEASLPEETVAHQKGTRWGLADVDLAHNTFRLEPVGAPDPENGPEEVNCVDCTQAIEEQRVIVQAYLDSLVFETTDLQAWAGDDVAKAMEGEYAALDIVTLDYFVRVAVYSPELARVEVTGRLGSFQTTGVTWRAYYKADEQISSDLLGLVGCSFVDWEEKIQD